MNKTKITTGVPTKPIFVKKYPTSKSTERYRTTGNLYGISAGFRIHPTLQKTS
jgi:hypothetical protein